MNRDCSVCLEKKPSSEFKKLEKCDHCMTYCNDCWKKHISYEINSKNQSKLKCPICKRELVEDEVKRYCSNKDFARYCDLLLDYFLQQQEFFRWCSRPGCGSGQEVEGGNSNSFFTCSKCKFKTCYFHKVSWHSGQTCSEYDDWIHQDESNETENYLAANTKGCPKCSRFVVKGDDGCDHLKCACNYEFCWLCLADFDDIRKYGNQRHRNTCQHYRPYDEN